MKILFVHNNYASNNSGEEHASQGLADLLTSEGHTVEWFRKSSDVINDSFGMKLAAFFLGIYNPVAVRALKKQIEDFEPDLIQIQNLYPFISPAIIGMIKRKKIPLVMRCPNYRLFCPTGLHLDQQNELCFSCLSGAREFNCIRKNCEKNHFKSTGYAIRNFFARTVWGITKRVDSYIVQSDFQKKKFIENGIPEEKLFIVPGLTPSIFEIKEVVAGDKVSFIGRVSEEKGIDEFIEAARTLPKIPFEVIGDYSSEYEALKENSPENVVWRGYISGRALDVAFKNSRIVVVPSKNFEGFPNVITRAMKHDKPVITCDLGAMASIIDHEKTGLLVPPGDAVSLAQAIRTLYPDIKKCKEFGEKGRRKANMFYSSSQINECLWEAYTHALSASEKIKA